MFGICWVCRRDTWCECAGCNAKLCPACTCACEAEPGKLASEALANAAHEAQRHIAALQCGEGRQVSRRDNEVCEDAGNTSQKIYSDYSESASAHETGGIPAGRASANCPQKIAHTETKRDILARVGVLPSRSVSESAFVRWNRGRS